MMTSAALATLNDHVLASSGDSEGGIGMVGLLFFLSGFAFYAVMYLRYRNSNKRNLHESETEATLLNMKTTDVLVKNMKGLKNRSMKGANNNDVRGSKNTLF